MGEEKKEEEKKNEGVKKEEEKKEEKKEEEPLEIVLKVDMHCEACARKVARSLRGFQEKKDLKVKTMERPWRSSNEYEGQSSKLGVGGWQPVVRRHGGRGGGAQREKNIYSVFVDNIPASMGANGLYKIFSNFGVVLDAYIPNKRRRSTGSRFGFIRYGCPIAVDLALQKTHGLWCDDKALKVKRAQFRKEYDHRQKMIRPVQQWKEKDGYRSEYATHHGGKSYADAVRGRVAQPSSTRVEEVTADCKASKVVVKGKTADPIKVLERIQKKSGRKVELISPLPKPPEDNKEETKEQPKEDKKEEPPAVVTVVLKVGMHCEACAQVLQKRIRKIPGVESAMADLANDQVIVKGIVDPTKLVNDVYKKTRKQASIVKDEEKKEEEKKEDEKKEGGEGEKKEGEEGKGGEEDKKTDIKKSEYWHPSYAMEYAYPPQIFSDENPNACSVM